jgi:hypothetical protein
MEKSNKLCVMCGAIDYNGIILNGERICSACEQKIIKIKPVKSDYNIYKDKIKIVLFGEHAKE